MTKLMRGANTARAYLAAYLAASMPPLLDAARSEWDKPEWQMPDPVVYDAHDPLSMSVYPTVGSYIRTTNDYRTHELTESAENVYSTNYAVTLFVWVITPTDPDTEFPIEGMAAVMDLRDDMVAIMLSAVLAYPSLGSGGAAVVDETTISTDYLEPIKVSSEDPRWLAGGTISFNMRVKEQVWIPPAGRVENIVITTQKLER